MSEALSSSPSPRRGRKPSSDGSVRAATARARSFSSRSASSRYSSSALVSYLEDIFPGHSVESIVNVVDQRVLKPTPRFFSYTLSKSALHSATITLAQALAPRLRVNAVAPGPTLPSPRQSPAQFAAQAASVPLGRGPSPEDIAAAVVYLAGATSVTGTVIAVDGGQHVAWRTLDSDGAE